MIRHIILATVLSGVAASAVAQKVDYPGSRIQREPDYSSTDFEEKADEEAVRQIQLKWGKCAASRHRAEAARYVTGLDYEKSKRDIARLRDGRCLLAATSAGGSKMSFPGDSFRYTLADALVRSELSGEVISDLAQVAPLAHQVFDPAHFQPPPGHIEATQLERAAQSERNARVAIYLSHLGECVVRADPANSHAVVMTWPSSAEESAAFSKLSPALGGCVEKGSQFKLSKPLVRGTLAYNYYRLARAVRTAPQPGGAK